jgi:hypothetical protein
LFARNESRSRNRTAQSPPRATGEIVPPKTRNGHGTTGMLPLIAIAARAGAA